MKIGLIIITLFIIIGTASAGDVSCQTDLMKPKIKAAVIDIEVLEPTGFMLAEGRVKSASSDEPLSQKNAPEEEQETAQVNEDETNTEAEKKESRLGGLFEILLPSKLRNPARRL